MFEGLGLPDPIRGATIVNVPHVNQKEKWDCGLACLMMVLKGKGVKDCDLDYLKKLCPTKSIWTIDLAYLLRRFGVDLAYFTITVGTNPKYASESFYVDHLQEDQHRVDQLFSEAPDHSIPIYECALPIETLTKICRHGSYTIIALVEKNTLWKSTNRGQWWLDSLCGMVGGYVGHYVLICGHHPKRNEFLIRDPAMSIARGVWVGAHALDAARKAFGTDEDLLLVSMNGVEKSIGGNSGVDFESMLSGGVVKC
ncbi:hypothetical protein BSKO_04765 [Bryopsis sp. KO-2023]|nr:hypothetical protein BSKO_04765 [Bryopsis sp. KO-2023]